MTDRSFTFALSIRQMSKGEQTRQMIIERSAPIFNRKGIAATAMSDIMEATGLAKGSLYVHFDNKDVLAAAVVDYNLELLERKLLATMNRLDHPRDKLFAFIDACANPLNPLVPGGCPMLNFGMEADDQYEAIREKVATAVNKSQQLIVSIITRGIKEGFFKADWNYKEFATLMFAMVEGGILITRTTRKTDKMTIINRNLKKMIEAQLR
jgi:AcrR family transcriptional regulator